MTNINIANREQNLLEQCKKDKKSCRKALAYQLLRLLTEKPGSFMLPSIPGISFIDISSGPVIPSHTSPPPEGPWYVKLDDTFWVAYPAHGSWNESEQRWDAPFEHIWLNPVGTWADGYRPTHVRVAHTGGSASVFAVENVAEEYLTIEARYTSMTIEPLIYPSADPADDIYWLYIIGDWPTITNIEFFLE